VPLRSSGRKILSHCAGVLPQIKITTAYFLLFKLDGLKRFKADALQRSIPNSRDSEYQWLLLYTIFQTRLSFIVLIYRFD